MKVYVLLDGDGTSAILAGVFSDIKLAKKFALEHLDEESWYIVEQTIDETAI